MSVFQELTDYIDTIAIVNTHCHKLPEKSGFPNGLKELVENSYLGWCHRTWDGTREAAAEFVRETMEPKRQRMPEGGAKRERLEEVDRDLVIRRILEEFMA